MDYSVPFDSLPLPALLIRDNVIVAATPSYLRFTGFAPADVIGRGDAELAAAVFLPEEHQHLASLIAARTQGLVSSGDVWFGLRLPSGLKRARVSWTMLEGGDTLVTLFDLGDDGRTKALSDALARAAGLLVTCSTEEEILQRSAEALFSHGLAVSVLRIRPGEPMLAVGPTLGCEPAATPVSVPARLLDEQNPAFSLRRAAFLETERGVVSSRPDQGPTSGSILGRRPLVQAPLFVDDLPYGAIIAVGEGLTPGLAGAVEMFTELVARALESTRRRAELALRLDELRQLQAELVVRERLAGLGEAAAVLAHEVRNPLAAMLNAVAIVRKEATPADHRAAALDIIDEEANRLNSIVRDLVDLGRPLVARKRLTVARDLLDRAIRLLDKRGDLRLVKVTVQGDASIHIVVDPDLMDLAVENVIRNAVQACGSNGTISARVDRVGDKVALLVDDSGPGISAGSHERVFEPFFTTRATGTGLGLAVVRRIVEANGGQVDAQVSPLGGARLRIELPDAAGSAVDNELQG